MRKKLLFSFCALLMLLMQSIAQTITVIGKVTDEVGQPLSRAVEKVLTAIIIVSLT